jgi:hypothetical protein
MEEVVELECSIIEPFVFWKAIKFYIRLGIGQESDVGPFEEEILTIQP